MVRRKSYLHPSLIEPKVRFQDDGVRPAGTSPTVLMVKQRPKNQLHWVRISAHCAQHNPEIKQRAPSIISQVIIEKRAL